MLSSVASRGWAARAAAPFRVRVAAAALDAVFVLALAALAVAAFPASAHAYVDPSVMTYTIQAVAGVAVALSAVLGVVWRRARRKVYAVLKIDENVGKVVEPDVCRVDPAAPLAADPERDAATMRLSAAFADAARVLTWPARFARALAATVFAAFTVLFVAPCEIVASNASELAFGLGDVWLPLALAALVVAVALALALSLARGRAFDVLVGLVVALGVATWAQAMFMNQSLPAADGSTVNWAAFWPSMVASLVVWAALVGVFVVFALRKTKLFRSVALGACAALVVVQAVGVGSLFVSAPGAAGAAGPSGNRGLTVTEEGLMDVSAHGNVVVFVLDTFDTAIMDDLLASRPEAFDELTGFTYFEDSTGSMVPTRYAVPYLLSGELPREGESFSAYLNERYDRSSFADDIAKAGYSMGVYTDSLGKEAGGVAQKSVNIHRLEHAEQVVDVPGTLGILYKCAFYRDMPWVAKAPFRFYTDEVNSAMLADDLSEASPDSVPYVMNDAAYFDKLTGHGLRVDAGDARGAFRFIHLQGSHYPYTMDENAQFVGEGASSMEAQSLGSIAIVSEYVRQLKELGLYEDATVIVTADHGYWYSEPGVIDAPTSPLMMVKPACDAAQAARPLAVSSAPVSHLDFPATVIDAMGGNGAAYGQTVWQAEGEGRERRYYMTSNDGWDDTVIREFVVSGDAMDFGNWSLTGREWDAR